MKKVLIASGVAVLAFAMIASAASFNTNLTVGSTGADVVALQTALMNAGYNIPAIAAGTPKGYFGSQTQTAVKAYQAARSIPSTGFVGPLTRAALNGGAMVTTPVAVGCPAGYTCTANVGTTPVVTTPGVITTPGMAGTLALTLQGSPSGATLDKGESEDIARYKLQASASDMQVTSLALDFDVRLWLYASSVVIKDDAGVVIASKSGLTQNDFIELTVGSSYRLYVPVSYVVPRAASKYFTVNVTMLPASDRCATTCTLTLSKVQVRSVDGTGVTDTQTDGTDRTFSFTGTNSGQLVTTVNASSPLKKLVQISNSNETAGVVLGIVDLKSQNKDATLRTLKIFVKTDGTSVNTLFSRIKIKANGQEYTANTIDTSSGSNSTASSTVTFTDLTIPLPKDVYVPVTITADVAKPSSTGALDGKSASTTLVANTTNIVAEDSTFNSVTINAGTVISSDQIFSASGAMVSNMVATLGSPVLSNNVTVAQPVSFTYTLTAGDNALYVSAAAGVALGTTTTGYTNNSSTNASTTLTNVTLSPSELSGDSSGSYYVIPAGGSRTFTWSGQVKNDAPSGVVLRSFAVTSINYGTTASSLNASSINYNLGTLKVTPVI
jgi:hypothetical protein